MRRFEFVTVDVFTDRRFGGNPLAVFPDARGLSDAEMQALAAELNLSETTFVLPPADPANTARVRIFTRQHEMPFAGHPNVGTGFVLADRAVAGLLRFEEIAGLVEVRLDAQGTTIAAPQPLTLDVELPAGLVARAVGLAESDIVLARHAPVRAGTGNFFVLAEVTPAALGRAQPDFAGFRAGLEAVPELAGRFALYLYAPDGDAVRARMFAPLGGTVEDPATGSAATSLAALLLKLSGAEQGAWDITQGVEMGRPSLLRTTARRAVDGIRATVGGGCVPMLRGEIQL